MIRTLRDRLAGAAALPLFLLFFVIWLGVQIFAEYNSVLYAGNIFHPIVMLTSTNVFSVSIPIFILIALVMLIVRISRPIGHWKRTGALLVFFGFPIAILGFIFLTLFGSPHTFHGRVTVDERTYYLVSQPYAQLRCDPTCYPPHLTILECDSASFFCRRGWELPRDQAFYAHFTANDFALVDESGGQQLTVIVRDGYIDPINVPLPLAKADSEDAT